MKININTLVRVKLTSTGRDILQAYLNELLENVFQEDDNMRQEVIKAYSPDRYGYFEHSLWKIMSIFGSGFEMGNPVPFSGNVIEIKENE